MRWLLLLLLLWAVPVHSAELRVEPQAVPLGGVFWVRFSGLPAATAVVEFSGGQYPLAASGSQAGRLLGVDLETSPGLYPLRLTATDQAGTTRVYQTSLEVLPAAFAEERLSLPEEMVTPQGEALLARIARERKRLLALFARPSSPPAPGVFFLPVGDPPGSSFGLRRVLNGQPRSPHSGLDFRSPRGRRILSPAAGEVVLADELFYTGRTLVIDHGGGLYSLLAHLDEFKVRPGARVAAGECVGLVGSSGRATGPHLHWSVRLNQARVDPLAVQRAIAGKILDSPESSPDNSR